MTVIALTGGIATGKSTVSAMLAARGAAVIDADLLAREVVAPGSDGLAEVVAHFGRGVLGENGELDRGKLGAIVFGDATQRRVLESITHPRIRLLTASRVAAASEAGAPLIVVDIPLLFETGREADFPGVLLVYADPATQLLRLRGRDGLDDEAAGQRLAAQLPIDSKRTRATWVIDNSGNVADTEAQVQAWWREHTPAS